MDFLPTAFQKQSNCEEFPRPRPDNILDEDSRRSFAEDFRVTPLYELEAYELAHKKAYSMVTNERMRCQWKQYINKTEEERKRPPFQLSRADDYHFYNFINRYALAESTKGRNYRMHLSYNLTDSRGSVPIAHERIYRKSKLKHMEKPHRIKSGKKTVKSK